MTGVSSLRVVLVAGALAGTLACASRPPARSAPRSELAATVPSPGWTEEGIASWYGGKDGFEGKPTASGEIYDSSLLTAAHRELPLGSVVDVVNVENGKSVRVRVNDRGPFIAGRVIDLSRAAARQLDLIGPGTGPVRLTLVVAGLRQEIVSPTGHWAVQVGSFADHARAEHHAERLRGMGRAVFLEPYRGLLRVKVGPFDGRHEAELELEALREEGFEGIVVPTD